MNITDEDRRRVMADRQTGKTTQQIASAPLSAVFIWLSSDLRYPKRLAATLGRSDITIESPDWLEYRSRGTRPSAVVVDHAARLTRQQRYGLWAIQSHAKKADTNER